MRVRCHGELDGRDRWGGLIWGLGLIALGVVFLLHFLGVMAWAEWGTWWPALVIFFGLLQLLTARRPRKVGSAVSVTLLGGWMLLATTGWHGLGWSHSWPLALVAVGIGTVVRALATSWTRHEHRDDEVEVDVLP